MIRVLYNEYLARVVESCYDYVLDSPARGGMDFKANLASVEVTLRSNCWTAQNSIRIGDGSPAHAKVCDEAVPRLNKPDVASGAFSGCACGWALLLGFGLGLMR